MILQWNRSIYYALAIGHLADRLVGLPPLSSPPSDRRGLAIAEVQEIQRHLNTLGYEVGEPDGRIGPMTRRAMRNYQRDRGLEQDAYADPELLVRLRGEAK